MYACYFYTAPSGAPLFNNIMPNKTSTTLDLEWEPPLRQHRNGIIIRYSLQIRNVATGNVSVLNNIHSTNTTVRQLLPYTTYEYQIAAYTSVGRGPFTSPLSIQTNQDGKYKNICTNLPVYAP